MAATAVTGASSLHHSLMKKRLKQQTLFLYQQTVVVLPTNSLLLRSNQNPIQPTFLSGFYSGPTSKHTPCGLLRRIGCVNTGEVPRLESSHSSVLQ